jgi:hypothetical protein
MPIMERIELEELKAHLMATNEEYRGFASQHSGSPTSWTNWKRFPT